MLRPLYLQVLCYIFGEKPSAGARSFVLNRDVFRIFTDDGDSIFSTFSTENITDELLDGPLEAYISDPANQLPDTAGKSWAYAVTLSRWVHSVTRYAKVARTARPLRDAALALR